MKAYQRGILFAIGGMGYVVLEFLWRGRSHVTMFFLGGLCFLLIGHLGELPHKASLPVRMLLGAGIITALELGTGLLFNRNFEIWDYRNLWPNFLGQISLIFSLLWIPVSLGAIWIYDTLSRKMQR